MLLLSIGLAGSAHARKTVIDRFGKFRCRGISRVALRNTGGVLRQFFSPPRPTAENATFLVHESTERSLKRAGRVDTPAQIGKISGRTATAGSSLHGFKGTRSIAVAISIYRASQPRGIGKAASLAPRDRSDPVRAKAVQERQLASRAVQEHERLPTRHSGNGSSVRS